MELGDGLIGSTGAFKELEIVTDTTDGYGFNSATNEELHGMVVSLEELKSGAYVITKILV